MAKESIVTLTKVVAQRVELSLNHVELELITQLVGEATQAEVDALMGEDTMTSENVQALYDKLSAFTYANASG